MARIQPLEPDQTTGKARTLLEGVERKLGRVPNLMRTMAHSPAVLESYLSFSDALSGGALTPAQREQIAVAVAATNGCDYCLAAHTLIGKGAGVSDADLAGAQTGEVGDPKARAAIALARGVIESRGFIDDGQIEAARRAGLGDAEILEVTAAVALNILTNSINHVAETEVDFPAVENRLHATA